MEELLEAYVRYLVAEKNLSPLTLRNYRSDLLHFARYLEDEEGVPVLEADRMMARRYLGMLKESGMATAGCIFLPECTAMSRPQCGLYWSGRRRIRNYCEKKK